LETKSFDTILSISSINKIGLEKASTRIQSFKVKGVILKILLKNGKYRIIECNATDEMQASINRGFENKPTLNILESSERAFKAFNISIMTKTERLKVEALAFP